MNKVALSGEVRNETGTKGAAQLRRAKRVPCVLYGGGTTHHFSVEEAALNKIVFTAEVNSVELDLGGTKTLALVKDKQFHPVTDQVIHVDFVELNENAPARATLAVNLHGQPVGVRKGGKLKQSMRKLRVKGLPVHIPQHLDVDVSGLDVNQQIRVADLKFDGLTLMERPEDVVVAVRLVKKVEAAPVATAAPTAAAAPAKAEAKPAAKK
ncbi:MAG: 50S ribosomal protein L25 [Flavobacteriales bacterium]|nr:50S ribosomal protein L25 [Flavobacteriales bacterium]